MNQFYVIAFVIVNLSETYYEVLTEICFRHSPLSVSDKYNDQCFVMLLFGSEHLKIP